MTATLPTGGNAAEQHAIIGIPPASTAVPAGFQSNPHPDAAWFRQGNFGLFIHWGISTVNGTVDLSWGMMAGAAYDLGRKITPRAYFALAERFQPDDYDPRKWLSAAKRAGINHAILTTKHHDGFALWPSADGDYNTRFWQGGRDYVGEYVAACRDLGIKVGLYYSPPDWHFNRDRMSFGRASSGQPPTPHLDQDHQPRTLPAPSAEWEAAYHQYLRGQIVELLTRYGTIDLLFFDGRPEVISLEEIRALQPGILVNERMHGYGDYTTPECRIPDKAQNPPWEAVDVWDVAGRWGYSEPFLQKPASLIKWNLCRCLGMRGNYMINVGPMSNGALPQRVYDDLDEIARWLQWAAPALENFTPATQVPHFPANDQGDTLYIFVTAQTWNLISVEPARRPLSVTLLRNGTALQYAYMDKFRTTAKLNIVPPSLLGDPDSVEVIRIDFRAP